MCSLTDLGSSFLYVTKDIRIWDGQGQWGKGWWFYAEARPWLVDAGGFKTLRPRMKGKTEGSKLWLVYPCTHIPHTPSTKHSLTSRALHRQHIHKTVHSLLIIYTISPTPTPHTYSPLNTPLTTPYIYNAHRALYAIQVILILRA
jgi:hypothetical protein